MIRTRRLTALTVGILAALPAAASAAVTCPPQPPLNAWAGSPKTLKMAPCAGSNGPVTYSVAVAPLNGTVTLPAANGTFVYTGDFNPNGPDPTGSNPVTFDAVDADNVHVQVQVPVNIGPAPETKTTFRAKDLQPDAPLANGTPTFDTFYKVQVTATTNVTDPTPGTPLSNFSVRLISDIAKRNTQAPTNVRGNVAFKFKPLVSDLYTFNVPSLPGTFFESYVLWVAPDWKLASTFPVKNRKFVISGRLLANKSARTKGSFVRFQRKKGSKWITVVSKVPVAAAMTFTVKVSRANYAGKRVRFVYVSKNDDYIGSSYAFTIKAAKPKTHKPPSGVTATNFGSSGGLAGDGNNGGSCHGADCASVSAVVRSLLR